MKHLALLLALLASTAAAREPVVGGPCEGCEAVYVGLPAKLESRARIAPAGEPGTPLRIEGTVRTADDRPAAGVIVYAYHTNAQGIYPPDPATRGTAAARHGRLRAWVQTDAQGRYVFETIRPGGYPGRLDPEHVHLHVIEPGRCTYYIDDIVFRDDPRLTAAQIARVAHGRGGSGITQPRRAADGGLRVERNILLGAAIPGYPR